MNPWFLFAVQNVALPLAITLATLYFDQRWHAIQAFNHAYAKAISLGVDSRRHPEKVTLEAMFMAQEAELEYVCENLGKDTNQVFRDLEAEIADKLMEHAFRGKGQLIST